MITILFYLIIIPAILFALFAISIHTLVAIGRAVEDAIEWLNDVER